MKTPELLKQLADEMAHKIGHHWTEWDESNDDLLAVYLAEALAQIQRETAEECAGATTEYGDSIWAVYKGAAPARGDLCKGDEYTQGISDGAHFATNKIRLKFGLLCNLCGKPKGSASGCCGCAL